MIVKIDGYDNQGRGIVRGDVPIFIANALPDEVVDIKIIKKRSKYALGNVLKIIEKSPQRISPICPFFGICGGCQLMHLSYKNQLLYKENKVKDIFKRNGLNVKFNDIIPSCDTNYRNKVTFHIEDDKLGFYKLDTNEIIEIDECKIIDAELNKKLKELKSMDLKQYETVVLKKGIDNNMTVLTDKLGDDKYLDSPKQIINDLNGFKFLISKESFFQVNTKQAEVMYSLVKEKLNLNNNDEVLDLYCGTGTIGITLTPHCKYVYGVEINAQAIKDATQNKELNNIENISFTCLDASKVSNLKLDVNKVVVDPPRAGLDKDTIKYLTSNKFERIVYVSCDPMTLVRDLKMLNEVYDILEVTPLDMFPNTYHVENIAVLSLKNGK